ncbi:hypothetical protein, partial [Metapseudomonas otitidis]|uniref:hypothetical protein n=1 Tax=Metapseudomonas otitidis TaxID=319939 RepID=UPI0036723527
GERPMSDVKRCTIYEAFALLPYGAKVIAEADYDALAAAHEQAWKSATSESHAWAREHEARMLVEAERDQLRAELEAIRGQQPDAVSVPRELLERLAGFVGAHPSGKGLAEELRALLSTKNAEEGG